MRNETLKIKILLFITLFFKRIYERMDKIYVKEWDKIRAKISKRIRNESPPLIYDSRQAYREKDIHSGFIK